MGSKPPHPRKGQQGFPFQTLPHRSETTGRKAAQVRLKGTINRKFDGMVILMKKIRAVMLSLLACTVLLAGCNTSPESNEEQPLKVYSFSGENEYISVSNGVIILDGKNEICYGGDLKTTNLSGEENTYQVQLETTEITKEVK